MGNSLHQKTLFPLLLSLVLLLHLGFLLMHFEVGGPRKTVMKEDQTKPIKVRVIPLELSRQIVQSSDSKDRSVREKAFLSDKTRSFDRQTRSRVTDVFKEGQKADSAPKKSGKNVKLSDLGAMVASDPFEKAAKDYSDGKNGQGKARRSVSSTNDYIEDIPLGDLTELNTVEYKFYGFYHRIKQRLEQFWGRSLEEKTQELMRQKRSLEAEEMITSLQITLDDNGEILAIKVLGSSGVQELDDAAIESFNEAGPFPNPPKGLVVDGKVTIEWGFVVKS